MLNIGTDANNHEYLIIFTAKFFRPAQRISTHTILKGSQKTPYAGWEILSAKGSFTPSALQEAFKKLR